MHIGRGLSADLHLDEKSVSRRHAMLVDRPAGARLLDDRSSNGTFVNGRRIVQADLNDGDVLRAGPRGPALPGNLSSQPPRGRPLGHGAPDGQAAARRRY